MDVIAVVVLGYGIADVAMLAAMYLQARRHHRERLATMERYITFNNAVALHLAQLEIAIRTQPPPRRLPRFSRRRRRRKPG